MNVNIKCRNLITTSLRLDTQQIGELIAVAERIRCWIQSGWNKFRYSVNSCWRKLAVPLLISNTINTDSIRIELDDVFHVIYSILYRICSNESNKYLDSVTYIYIQIIWTDVFRRCCAICTIIWICECFRLRVRIEIR